MARQRKQTELAETEKLTIAERRELETLERTIETGVQSFVEVGRALTRIRDERLYREDDKTFDAYCRRAWGFTRQRAHQLIDSAGVAASVAGLSNERQARELLRAPEDRRGEAFERAGQNGNGNGNGSTHADAPAPERVTASRVRAAVDEIIEPEPAGADEPAEPETDAEGREIPEQAKEAFAARTSHYLRAMNLLAELSGIVNELAGDAGNRKPIKGGELLVAFRQETKRDIKNIRETLKSVQPHAACPYCAGRRSNCRACKGLGWVAKSVYDEAPAEMKRGGRKSR